MRVRKELEPEPWVGAESSWGKVVVVSNYAQASKQASQRARPSTEPAIKRGSLEQSSTNYLWALHWPFLRDFKRTCNSWPLTVLQLTKCCCWPILLFVIYWCRLKIEFLQLADCQSINQTSFDQPWILLHTHCTLASFHVYSLYLCLFSQHLII